MEQREIKFRAWVRLEKNKLSNNGDYIDELKMINWKEHAAEIGWYISGECDNDWKDVVIQQYTGLHDKNGKEIYEGDIVNDDGIVEFVGGRYIIIYPDEKFEDLIGSEDEIIGNVFENPKLLEK